MCTYFSLRLNVLLAVYTIKDRIIYDANKLLEDIQQLVVEARQERNGYQIMLPGLRK